MVWYCIVLYCIVLYCICLGSTFCNQVNLIGDQLSAISGSCVELGGRAVVTVWLPRRCDDAVTAVGALSRYRGGRGVQNHIATVFRGVHNNLYCIVLYCCCIILVSVWDRLSATRLIWLEIRFR